MSRKQKSRARRIAVLALILLGLLALGVALLDDASGPPDARSSSIPPVPQARVPSASGTKAGTADTAPAGTSAPAHSGSSAPAVDKVPPLTPTFTQTPLDPSSTATSRFAWTSTDPAPGSGISHYLCSKENGAYVRCGSPHTYDVSTTNNGQHQFSVVAVDGAGNTSPEAKYRWKVAKGSPAEFTIEGSVSGLVPGTWVVVPVRITNPNTQAITVTSLTVTVAGSASCGSANFETQPSAVPFVVPGNATTHSVPQQNQPRIRLKNLATSQDSCKSQTVGLSFHGSANGP
jgi:hypothetical protein